MNSNKPTQSYLENYKILKEIAEKMRQSEDLDIDQLIPLVEKATQAYQQCQAAH
jgi:exodeoxyribonuclease VII small subunit